MASRNFSTRVAEVVQLEYVIIILLGAMAAWIFYKTALRKLSHERHKNLKNKFCNLIKHLVFLLVFSVPYFLLSLIESPHFILARTIPYLGLAVLCCATLSLLKVTRISVLEFLFLGNMKAGVPLLIVNIFTLVLSLVLGAWYMSAIFGIELGPLLATSAVFSLVLGLALQDTISNLFAGLGVQFDHSFQIGDWIEVSYQDQKWSGKVEEVSWRSTTLLSLTEEIVIIPNRTISQALINNFAQHGRPFIRGQFIKVDYGTPEDVLKEVVIQASQTIDGIIYNPAPMLLFWEPNENYAIYKLIYYIGDYGRQYFIADKLLSKISQALIDKNIKIATPKFEIKGQHDS